MKNIFYILFITLINLSFSQQELTLEDAVLNRWTSFSPERLDHLQWNNEEDFFSYKASDSIIYICDINNGPMCGGGKPNYWYKDCWDDYLKCLKKMMCYKI